MFFKSPLKSKRRAKQEIDASQSLLSPTKGWNARDPEGGMPPGYALYLDNWFPTPANVVVRKGAADHVTGIVLPVKGLHTYSSRTGVNQLFGTLDTGVFDYTTAGVASGTNLMALADGRTLGVNYGTTGGSYLFLVNGVDSMKQYDGTTWTSVASFTIDGGGTLNTNEIANLNVFKRSLFFIHKQTLEFFYLPIDSIAGTVFRFNLAALFSKGGQLVSMGTWSIDGGVGLDDYAAFVTDQGQMAIYKGTDPASADTFSLVGIFDLSPPLGKKCFLKFGGDLLYLSRDGVFPLSKALLSTSTNLTPAVTDVISTAFSAAASSYGLNDGWQGIFSLTDSLLLFNIPVSSFSTAQQFLMNTKTRAWCRITGWNASCWALMNNQLYMGMAGKVAKAWYGLNDFGEPISAFGKTSFEYLTPRARIKHIKLCRPNLRINGSASVNIAIDVDFNNGMDYGPTVYNPAVGSLWNVSQWNVGTWSGVSKTRLDWVTCAVPECYCAATRLRVAAKDATVEWSALDLVFETGSIRG